MTKWEARSDSEGSDPSAREGLGSLPKHKGNVVGEGEVSCAGGWGEAVTEGVTDVGIGELRAGTT